MQPDTGYQNGSYRHQRHAFSRHGPITAQGGPDKGALVLAKQFFHPFERNRIDVPCIAREVANTVHGAGEGRVETVVHARREAQGHKAAVAPVVNVFFCTQQVFQGVRKAFGLKSSRSFNAAMGPHDGIHRTGHRTRVGLNGPCAIFQLAGKAGMHAFELGLSGLGQVQVREILPDADGGVLHPRYFYLAEPAHEARQRHTRQTVGQQKVDVFLIQDVVQLLAEFHASFSRWFFFIRGSFQ
jgi:hypothetical protein